MRYMSQDNRRRRERQPDHGQIPVRDAHDRLTLIINFVGVVCLVATIAITLNSNKENGRATADAIAKMARIANTLQGQQSVLVTQANATTDLAKETDSLAHSSAKQAEAAAQTAANAQVTTKIAQQESAIAYKQLAQNLDMF